MPPRKTFTAILHDGRDILASRANCDDEELARLNDQTRETLGTEFRWEPIR
jgi:hypothetical protein